MREKKKTEKRYRDG
uniref:Uncharacterized protein n=1 Tax=Rhizophora mucronata TaxID=61149 RepID=A0A2P2JZC7_RHIMU